MRRKEWEKFMEFIPVFPDVIHPPPRYSRIEEFRKLLEKEYSNIKFGDEGADSLKHLREIIIGRGKYSKREIEGYNYADDGILFQAKYLELREQFRRQEGVVFRTILEKLCSRV